MIDEKRAEEIIEEIKQREIALGRPEDTWWTYGNHVHGVAEVAAKIASKIEDLDEERAYVFGLLHDVARIEEKREKRHHGVMGYEKLKDEDEFVARICLTHMFSWNKLSSFEENSERFFDNRADYDFMKEYLDKNPADDYDLLIQLADALANKNGIVTLEQRAQEYAERKKVEITPDIILPKLALKAYFDEKIGGDVYDLLSNEREE